jgi:hypothetical protein
VCVYRVNAGVFFQVCARMASELVDKIVCRCGCTLFFTTALSISNKIYDAMDSWSKLVVWNILPSELGNHFAPEFVLQILFVEAFFFGKRVGHRLHHLIPIGFFASSFFWTNVALNEISLEPTGKKGRERRTEAIDSISEREERESPRSIYSGVGANPTHNNFPYGVIFQIQVSLKHCPRVDKFCRWEVCRT